MVERMQGTNAVEKVSGMPTSLRRLAMGLAVDRLVTEQRAQGHPMTNAQIQAIIEHTERNFISKKWPERTLNIGGIMGLRLQEMWNEGERIVSRAQKLVDARVGRDWAAHFSRFSRATEATHGRARGAWNRIGLGRLRPDINQRITHPALFEGDKASEELTEVLNDPANAELMSALHREHIIEGTARYVRYLKYARQARENETAIVGLLQEWRSGAPGAAVFPNDNPAFLPANATDDDADRGEGMYEGMGEWDELVRRVPPLAGQTISPLELRLSGPEKVAYIEYLGETKTGQARMWASQSRIRQIHKKVKEEIDRAGPSEAVIRKRGRGERVVGEGSREMLLAGYPDKKIPGLTPEELDWYLRHRGTRMGRSPKPPEGTTSKAILQKVRAINRERVRPQIEAAQREAAQRQEQPRPTPRPTPQREATPPALPRPEAAPRGEQGSEAERKRLIDLADKIARGETE